MKDDFKQYLLAGVPFIFIGLLVNPWLVIWLTKIKLSTTIFTGILLISILLIAIGWGIIFKKNKFPGWLFKKYSELAVIILNLILLFGILNFIAAIILFIPVKDKPVDDYFYVPSSLFNDSIKFMRSIYPDKSDDEIKELIHFKNPYVNHPVLEFQEKIQVSEMYNVGFEGIRFDQKVTSETAPKLINGAVWLLGGSTTFGQGVKDNETIGSYLNRLDTSNTYINFGVHAYHQTNEIEKLVLLLRKGYKPSKVIFLDGLNDIVRMIETNFHPIETPALAKSAYNSDFNIATTETGNSLLKQLPATRLIRSYFGKEKGPDMNLWLSWQEYDNVYDQNNLYHKNPRQHFSSTILRSPYKQIDTSALNYIVWKLNEFYSRNYSFIDKLAQAYGFEFTVYYQPLGVLTNNNPFWKNKFKSKTTPLYTNFNYVVPRVREKLTASGLARFIDISDVHDRCPDCYVDLTHYNPELNRIIAETIIAEERY